MPGDEATHKFSLVPRPQKPKLLHYSRRLPFLFTYSQNEVPSWVMVICHVYQSMMVWSAHA